MSLLRTKRPRVGTGIGAYSHTTNPQGDPGDALAAGLKDGLSGPPGLRLAGGGGRRVYFAGQLTPQQFTRAPSETNAADSIRAAVLHVNAPRLFGKTRGRLSEVEFPRGGDV